MGGGVGRTGHIKVRGLVCGLERENKKTALRSNEGICKLGVRNEKGENV